MQGYGATFFETSIGLCGLAWTGRGVNALQLPEETPQATRARLRKRANNPLERAPPLVVAEAVEGVIALLNGIVVDLTAIPLDVDRIGEFERRVYEIARFIPCGETRAYGEIARAIGEPDAARSVGQALGRNPIPIIVPCHRVVAVGGKTGGFSAPGGVATKLRILEIERAAVFGQERAGAHGQLRLL